jgi:hypothetical protein
VPHHALPESNRSSILKCLHLFFEAQTYNATVGTEYALIQK